MEETTLEELKQEATDLGIAFSPNIGAAKLQEKIDAYYASQENSGVTVAEESAETIAAVAKENSRAARRAEANKTRIVKIIDNDSRVNGQATTVTVNCSNMYFDLGTIILPLNLPVEIRQGHLNVLKELTMPHHSKDNKTGLSTVSMVPRYTISYEDVKA